MCGNTNRTDIQKGLDMMIPFWTDFSPTVFFEMSSILVALVTWMTSIWAGGSCRV